MIIEIFRNLIFPLLIAVLGTLIWNFILEKRKKEAERKEKLYGPLRFYLTLMKTNKITREKLREDMHRMFREVSENLDSRRRGEILMKHSSQFSREIATPAIIKWWSHAHKINNLLENFSGLIKEDDWPLVQDFVHGLFLRELVVGKEKYKDTTNLFTDKIIDDGTNKFLDAVDKLQNKILK